MPVMVEKGSFEQDWTQMFQTRTMFILTEEPVGEAREQER